MKTKILYSFVLMPITPIGLSAHTHVQAEGTDKRPNIILFMVDDMGWQDTSLPFGHRRRITTNCMKLRTWNGWHGRE